MMHRSEGERGLFEPEPPRAVRWIARTLEEAGYETWTVGGAIRDALLGAPSEDWDLATRAKPAEVQRLFKRTIPVGIDHGTVGVLSKDGVLYEVTTFRRDIETTGRHAVVEFADSLDEDLARRDFTINAVAWHPLNKVLHDPFEGRADLGRRVLRTVGEPRARFAEDYLRVLRGLRFAGTFRFTIEASTWHALVAAVTHTRILSPERVREEMERILQSPEPSRALGLYAASGALAQLYPELDGLVGRRRDLVRTRSGGLDARDDWYAHSLRVIDLLSPERPTLRWAALLQGVGHEGSVAAILERLRSSNARIRDVAAVSPSAATLPDPDASEESLRRLLSAAGRVSLRTMTRLWIANLRADEACGSRPDQGRFVTTCRRLRRIARSDVPLAVSELAISGRDLIGLGYEPGPRFGEVLEHLLDRTLADPTLNRNEALREEAVRWMSQQDRPTGAGRSGLPQPGASEASETL